MTKLAISKKDQKELLGLMRLGYDGTKLLSPYQKFYYSSEQNFYYSSPSFNFLKSSDDFNQWGRSLRQRNIGL